MEAEGAVLTAFPELFAAPAVRERSEMSRMLPHSLCLYVWVRVPGPVLLAEERGQHRGLSPHPSGCKSVKSGSSVRPEGSAPSPAQGRHRLPQRPFPGPKHRRNPIRRKDLSLNSAVPWESKVPRSAVNRDSNEESLEKLKRGRERRRRQR